MIKMVDKCVQCWSVGLHCRGGACPYYNPVPVRCCDKCESEEQIYHFEGKELCLECIEELLEKVEED